MLNDQEELKNGEKRKILALEAWLIQSSPRSKLHITFSDSGDEEIHEVSEGSLICMDKGIVTSVSGNVNFRPLKVVALSKLLAFIDNAELAGSTPVEKIHCVIFEPEYRSVWEERKRCEYWFIQQIMTPTPIFKSLVTLLRKNESYWLISFLLAQSTSGNTMRVLGKNYGVSYTHFRRLCNQALGGRVKSELRNWRMAQSLLKNAEGLESITELAMNNGYSSSSHFSTEIKELIGVSPSKLSNIIQLADK